MTRPTDDELCMTYGVGYFDPAWTRGTRHERKHNGLRAVDDAAVRRTLDRLETWLDTNPWDMDRSAVAVMRHEIQNMRGDDADTDR